MTSGVFQGSVRKSQLVFLKNHQQTLSPLKKKTSMHRSGEIQALLPLDIIFEKTTYINWLM